MSVVQNTQDTIHNAAKRFQKCLFGRKEDNANLRIGKVVDLRSMAIVAALLFALNNDPAAAMSPCSDHHQDIDAIVIEGPSNAEMLDITLPPGGKVICDIRTILYMTDGVESSIETRGGSTFRRAVQGVKPYVTVYTNTLSSTSAHVGVAPEFPSRIVPIRLQDYGGAIVGNTGSFLAAPNDVALDFERTRLKGLALSFLKMERITRAQGTVYLAGSGNIIAKEIKQGETLRIFPGAWVAMTDQMELEAVQSRQISKVAFVRQQRLVLIRGPGTVWIDTAPISRIVDELERRLPKSS